jgi:serine phosphatase RsbU (regulator of sigma subunit)
VVFQTALPHSDLPIGLFPDTAYGEHRVRLSSGSALIVYSDGLIDALNSDGEEFGEERLIEHCRSLPKGTTSQTICASLSQCVAEWSSGAEQFDDTTILVLTAD